MQVINQTPTAKTIINGYKKFKFNWWRLVLFIVLFPLCVLMSRKYVQQFFKMNQSFIKTGPLPSDPQINFNSVQTYLADALDKKLDQQDFVFTAAELKGLKEVTILNKHQQKISSLILLNPHSQKWVIGLHGWTENKYLALRQVLYFYRQGYNVLTFDAIAHGLSYGQYTAIGFHNAANLNPIIDFIKKHYAATSIGLIGNSMGASCLLKYLTDQAIKPRELAWAVFDCGFINLLMQLRYVMTYRYHKPWWLISYGLSKIYQKKLGFKLKDYNLLKKLKNAKDFPLLILHGLADDFVPYFMSKKLYEKKLKIDQNDSTITLVGMPNVKHVQAICHDNQAYQKVIKDFLQQI